MDGWFQLLVKNTEKQSGQLGRSQWKRRDLKELGLGWGPKGSKSLKRS